MLNRASARRVGKGLLNHHRPAEFNDGEDQQKEDRGNECQLDDARAASASASEAEDVAWFFDAFTNLWPRDIPSEFHYHVKDTGERQACLRSYFATNTELRARPGGQAR